LLLLFRQALFLIISARWRVGSLKKDDSKPVGYLLCVYQGDNSALYQLAGASGVTMKKYHAYGIGAALVDTEIEVKDHELDSFGIEKGLMTLVDEARQQSLMEHLHDHLTVAQRASGGSAANSIIALSCFGGKTYYSCKVADDENGRFYLADLRAAGVDHSADLALGPGTTGKCLVLITPDAERTMNTYLGISESFGEENLNFQAIAQSHFLYIEGYLVTSPTGRAAAIKARQHAERNGTKTALSLSDPGMVEHFSEGLGEMIGDGVDLLFCNREEAIRWTGEQDMAAVIEALKATANTFAITLGARGALAYDGQSLHTIAPVPVTAVDTNGAGDMFAGAFLFGLSKGMGYEQAGKLASTASAAVVAQFGPRLHIDQHQGILNAVSK
jgi:sugar/nucleoside kinase (ribokinase family)